MTTSLTTGSYPYAVAVNPATNTVYVANANSNNVTVIAGATNTTATVAVGTTPYAIAVNPVTNMVYVANGDGTVTVINGATNATASVTAGNTPYAIAVNPVTNKVYVANEGSGTVTVIDGVTNATTTVTAGTDPYSVAVNPVTNKIYVANAGSGSVTVIDGAANTTSTVAAGSYPYTVAVNPVTNTVYVANYGGGTVTVINGATNTATATVTVVSAPYAVAVNPVTNQVYVGGDGGSPDVTVINGATNTATATVITGINPRAIAVNPVTNQIYVANALSYNVTVINGATNATTTLAVGGSGSNGPNAIAVNPVTDKIYVARGASLGAGAVTVIDGATDGTSSVTTGSHPQAVAMNPVTNMIYVANSGDNTVTAINGATNATTSIGAGSGPWAIGVNPATNTIYVANYFTTFVTAINGATNATTTIDAGTGPYAIAVNSVTNTIYVANYTSDNVTVINGATNTVAAILTAGSDPDAIAVNPVTNTIYVANSGSNNVTVIDGATNATATVGVGSAPGEIAVNPVTNTIYVANSGSNNVTVIDGATNATTAIGVGNSPDGIAVNPVTNTIYVANYAVNNVTVINGLTKATATVGTGSNPYPIAVNPVTNKVYVGNNGGSTVTVIDGATNTTSTVACGTGPEAIAVNPATNTVYVGNYTTGSVTVITEQQQQTVPLTASITPLAGNETTGASAAFTFGAGSSFSPTALPPQNVFFQVDTWQGPWAAATNGGSSWSGAASSLQPGFHILYAYADDGQDATSVQLDSPLISAIAAYGFLVLPAGAEEPAPVVNSSAAATGRVGVTFPGYTITASNSPASFSATGLPPGLMVNASTGVISGTPTAAGSFTVNLTATNATAASAVFPSTFDILPALSVPVVTSNPTAIATANAPFTPYTITASNSPTSFSAAGLPAGLVVNASTGVISGTPTVSGTFTVIVSTTNATGTSSGLPVTITIAPPPSAPLFTSNIGAGGTLGSDFSYTITASNAPTSFSATGLPPGLTVNASTGVISGTPTLAGTFDVTVDTINASGTGTGTLVLVVDPGYLVPVISSSSAVSGQVGNALSYTILANNAPTSFSATGLPPGLALNASTGIISGTPTEAGLFAVDITAVNAAGASEAFTPTITIAPSPQAPVITSAATVSGTGGVLLGYAITTNVAATSYAASGLPPGLALNSISGVISGTPSAIGSFFISLTASNTAGTSAPLDLILAVLPSAQLPSITSSLTAAGVQGQAFAYTVTASNMPTSPLPAGDVYAATGLPAGLGFNPFTGVISGMPTSVGTSSVVLTAANDVGAGEPVTLVITINAAANAPSITSGNTAGVASGSVFSYQITATPAASSYAMLGSPAWLGINTATGLLSGTANADSGTYSVFLTATDAGGTSAPFPLAITVGAAPGAPVVTSTHTPAAGTDGVVYADTPSGCLYQIQVLPSAQIQYYFASGLPPGLNLDPILGLIYGTPPEPGTYFISVGAANLTGRSGSSQITLTITAAAGSPQITNGGGTGSSSVEHGGSVRADGVPLAAGNVGAAFSFQIVATGSPTGYSATSLPVGLAVNPSTGLITGVPTTEGDFTAVISASNASGTGPGTDLSITIGPPASAPAVTSSPTSGGTAGTAFTYQIVASNAPTSYNASGLPAGLTLNSSTGAINGTPTIPGTYTVSLSANNASGTGSVLALTLTVASTAGAPTITSGSTASGTVGAAFAAYQVTAGNGPITAYQAIDLPAGLAIDPVGGAVTGTPTTAGSFTAILTATNAAGPSSPFALAITIAPAATSSSVTSLTSTGATAGAAFSYQITGSNSPTSFNVTGLPSGLAVNTATGLISGVISAAGSYAVTVSVNNATGTGATSTLTITAITPAYARLVNLSARAFVNTGSNILIAGFAVSGTGTKELLLRGVGPTLAEVPYGVGDALSNPQLTLYDSAALPGPYIIASNTGWANNPVLGPSTVPAVISDATAAIMLTLGAFPLPTNSLDSAVVATLPVGDYTSQIAGLGGTPTGVALAEIYDADSGITPSARLVNISARAEIGIGSNILIAGFAIAGNTSETVLIRGVGPGLASVGVPTGYIAQPQLALYDSIGLGNVIASNSGWSTAPTTGPSTVVAIVQPATASIMITVGAFPLTPNSADTAMLVTLPPGDYTAQLSGIGNSTGIGLVEVYEAP